LTFDTDGNWTFREGRRACVAAVNMARTKKSDVDGQPQVNLNVDNYFSGLIESARAATGRTDIQPAADTEDLIIGLRLPALSCAVLLQCDVLPLSRVVRVTGKRGCNKTALLCEMQRWFLSHSGFAVTVEAEGKDAPDLRASVFRHRMDWLRDRVIWHPADCQQDWQDATTRWVNQISAKQDVGGGWRYPLIVTVDSFTAAGSRDEQVKIDAAGHADRGYASEAMLNARYFSVLPSKVRNRPMVIAGTSHGVAGTDSMGRPEFRAKGGQAMTFYETFEIRVTKIASQKTARGGWNYLELRTDKNSLGADAVRLPVRFEWMYEPDPDGISGVRQVSNWDWHAATIEYMASLRKNQKGMWNDVNQVVDFHLTDSGRRGWSKALGVPSDKPISWTDLGKLLELRPDLIDQLYVPLNIRRRSPFIPGVPFAEQIAKGKAALRAMESASVYDVDGAGDRRFLEFDKELESCLHGPDDNSVIEEDDDGDT